jgi:hypothetical protein
MDWQEAQELQVRERSRTAAAGAAGGGGSVIDIHEDDVDPLVAAISALSSATIGNTGFGVFKKLQALKSEMDSLWRPTIKLNGRTPEKQKALQQYVVRTGTCRNQSGTVQVL